MTFCDPEAATRACADPNPVIDGRRANCNLASLGRPQLSLPYGIIFYCRAYENLLCNNSYFRIFTKLLVTSSTVT